VQFIGRIIALIFALFAGIICFRYSKNIYYFYLKTSNSKPYFEWSENYHRFSRAIGAGFIIIAILGLIAVLSEWIIAS
jgi:hypothetical protein